MVAKIIARIVSSIVLAAVYPAAGAQSSPPLAAWYLEKNLMTLDADNRFFETVDVVNKSSFPLYLRATLFKMELRAGTRVVEPEAGEPLLVSPGEFVVQPGTGFPVRIMANPDLQAEDSASYYVRLTDVSSLRAEGEGSGAVAAFSLAYDILTVVKKTAYRDILAQDFTLVAGAAEGDFRLVNDSDQHVYLGSGYACVDAQQPLVECEQVLDFPRQSLMPGEAVAVQTHSSRPFLGILLKENLGANTPQKKLYLKTGAADRPAGAPPVPDLVR